MIIAHHVIFAAYGFWLPNDPRGSWSDFVGSWEPFRYGPATKTDATRSVAHRPHDTQKRLAAKKALKYPPVVFSGVQATIGYRCAQRTLPAVAKIARVTPPPLWRRTQE
jgi:hypothetical protein